MADVAFATVASQAYIEHALGLYTNVREFYPDALIVICALDRSTEKALSAVVDQRLHVPRAEEVWGPEHWRNLCVRNNTAELAFATKAALTYWVLDGRSTGVLLLDSDVLILDRIDDLLGAILDHDILLVPSRHPVLSWRKSQTFGLFSAGVVGWSRRAVTAASMWRELCFDECRALPAAGLHYEQKYLEYFLGSFDVAIVRDTGINVSATVMRDARPSLADDDRWYTADGALIRIFHLSRTTATDTSLAQTKLDYNRRGVLSAGVRPKPRGGVLAARNAAGISKIVADLQLGRRLETAGVRLGRSVRILFTVYRVLTLPQGPLHLRIQEAFFRKAELRRRLSAGREARPTQ